jgi:hypothetical protein
MVSLNAEKRECSTAPMSTSSKPGHRDVGLARPSAFSFFFSHYFWSGFLGAVPRLERQFQHTSCSRSRSASAPRYVVSLRRRDADRRARRASGASRAARSRAPYYPATAAAGDQATLSGVSRVAPAAGGRDDFGGGIDDGKRRGGLGTPHRVTAARADVVVTGVAAAVVVAATST